MVKIEITTNGGTVHSEGKIEGMASEVLPECMAAIDQIVEALSASRLGLTLFEAYVTLTIRKACHDAGSRKDGDDDE